MPKKPALDNKEVKRVCGIMTDYLSSDDLFIIIQDAGLERSKLNLHSAPNRLLRDMLELAEKGGADIVADLLEEAIEYAPVLQRELRPVVERLRAAGKALEWEAGAADDNRMGAPQQVGAASPGRVSGDDGNEGRQVSVVDGAKSPPPPGPVKNRWAVLVGVNEYVEPSYPDLEYCVNDVVVLGETLEKAGYSVRILHDDAQQEAHPTRANVKAAIAHMSSVAGPDDLIWVHFAGHGKVLDGEPILLTRETREPADPDDVLRVAQVEQIMRKSPARRCVLTLDACHVGVEIGRGFQDSEFFRNVHELAEGFVMIAGSTAQQVAQERKDEKHGVFSYYLIEGLSGEAAVGHGCITASDLNNYVLDKLRKWSFEHHGLLQEPTYRVEGVGDMILVGPKSK